jgi:GMP synthase-like glutamine amidotransferase
MRPLLFVDCWPEIRPPGAWQDRFAAIPPAASDAGFTATVRHHTAVPAPESARPAGVILSGSRSNLMPDPSADPEDGIALSAFAALTALLAAWSDVPVLGICFGHQYLNYAAGGTLEMMPETRAEPAWPIAPLAPDPLFAGLPAPRCVESHRWRVASPGAGYRVIARSADGIEAVRHDTLPRAGVQFHPEYFRRDGATEDGRRILANWMANL